MTAKLTGIGILGSLWMVGLSLASGSALAQGNRALTIRADSQEVNANTGVVTARGNVTVSYPAEGVLARAQKLIYFTQEQRIVLEGAVSITQQQNQLQAERVIYLIEQGTIQAEPAPGQQVETIYVFPDPPAAPQE